MRPTTVNVLHWLDSTALVLDYLRHALPQGQESVDCIGLIGSASLALLQNKDSIGPSWGPPSDYDVFVCGRWARNEDTFRSMVMQVVFMIMRREGNIIHEITPNYTTYGRLGVKRTLVNVHLTNIQHVLSFISCPDCKDLHEVAAAFDIDVCRVIYRPLTGAIECDDSVREHIKAGVAVVECFDFGREGLSRKNIRLLQKTLIRIWKYKNRGFKFLNEGGVEFRKQQSRRIMSQVTKADAAARP